MKRLFVALLLILAVAVPAFSQGAIRSTYLIRNGATLPTTCDPLRGEVFYLNAAGSQGVFACLAANTWYNVGSTGPLGNILSPGFVTVPAASYFNFTLRSRVYSAGDGSVNLTDNAAADFTRLTLGPVAVTHPALTVSAAVGGQSQGIIITKGDGTAAVFADLGAATNGSMIYCSDCTFANPCAGAGSGALAKRLNGAWRCD